MTGNGVINDKNARGFFGLTSAVVTVGLVVQLILSINKEGGRFDTVPEKVLNFFSFFTVQSNISVAITTGLLAVSLHRSSTVFRVFRLVAMVCIAVTGVVFHLALADLQELTGWDLFCDTILHTISPIITVLGWAVFGPRGRLNNRIVTLAVIPPVCWLGYAFIYGALQTDVNGVHYYAYPFMDVTIHGYAVSIFRCAIVALLFLAIAFGAKALDPKLPGVQAADA